MTNAPYLHWFECNRCHAWATVPVLAKAQVKCSQCHIWLAYRWSETIRTDEQRLRAAAGIVFSRKQDEPQEVRGPMLVKCGLRLCYIQKPENEMVYLPGVGRYCSEAHAQEGERDWKAFMDRLSKLKQERPELEWPQKESA